jgi:hypothetical protein
MINVLTSSTVDHGFEPRSGQTKDYKIGICCFSAKHAAWSNKAQFHNRLTTNYWKNMEIKFSPDIYQPGDEIKLLRRVQGAE